MTSIINNLLNKITIYVNGLLAFVVTGEFAAFTFREPGWLGKGVEI